MWRAKPQQPPSWGQHSPRATRRHNQDLDPRLYADTCCCSPGSATRWDYFGWQAKVRRTHPRCPPSFSGPTAFLTLGLLRSTCVSSHPALLPLRPTGPASWFTTDLSTWKTQSDLSNTEVCAGFFNDFPSTPYQMNSQLLCMAWRASHSWPPAHLCSFISLCCPQSSPEMRSPFFYRFCPKNYSSSVKAPFGPQVAGTLQLREWPRARVPPNPGHKGQTAEWERALNLALWTPGGCLNIRPGKAAWKCKYPANICRSSLGLVGGYIT